MLDRRGVYQEDGKLCTVSDLWRGLFTIIRTASDGQCKGAYMTDESKAVQDVVATLTADTTLMSCGAPLIAKFGKTHVAFGYEPIPAYMVTIGSVTVVICSKQDAHADDGDIICGDKLVGILSGRHA